MSKVPEYTLLDPASMGRVDQNAAKSGINSFRLMQNAGEAIAACALKSYPAARRYIVLCGPGNNGGDGYIAAHALMRAGGAVALFALGVESLKGDARKAAAACAALPGRLDDFSPAAGDVVIDALFGAGLDRDLPPAVTALIDRVTAAGVPVVSADVPTGIDGRTGGLRGGAFHAARTVTFMCRKPGHLLLPGRDHCGALSVVNIGIPARIVTAEAGKLQANGPELWRSALPHLRPDSHKYTRGHLSVFSGGAASSGAARLSAAAALKAGAGAVTLVSPREAMAVNAGHLTAIMLKERNEATLTALLTDSRVTAFVIGPGFGAGDDLRALVHRLAVKPVVLDADAITSFAAAPDALFVILNRNGGKAILTPHAGEFARLFPALDDGATLSKVDKARLAAEKAHAVVIYKGADTVIAAPDGRAIINTNAPSVLATAGSGDVLAGICGSLLAQGMDPFDAAAAAVWIHGRCGEIAGRGLTAETLVDVLPEALPEALPG
jgi:ADP-dependent NAD(P)H-hydrate dehydratase / NAD(P)H-hydrate epimerase